MDKLNLYYPTKIKTLDEIQNINMLYILNNTHYIKCGCSKLFIQNNQPPAVIRCRYLKHLDSKKHYEKKFYDIEDIKKKLSLNLKININCG